MMTGVIGLGAMGSPMAINLNKAGHLAAIWNRTYANAEVVAAETGIPLSADLEAFAQQCDVIIISVSADSDLEQVVKGLIPGLSAGDIVIDTSTVSATTAINIATRLKKQKVKFLDAPVSGGVEGAIKGTLSMMVGGEWETLNQVLPILEAIASRIVHMGPVGNGQATKAVNQIMVAGINQAVTEALAFGQAMHLPMGKVIDVVSGGAAGNWFLDHRGQTMVDGRYAPGFRIALHDKDLRICLSLAEEQNISLPVVEQTHEQYEQLLSQGYGHEDISSLYRLKRKVLSD